MGINFRHLGQLQESIDSFRKAIDFNDSKPAAHNNCGLSNFEFEMYTDAIKDFTAAITKSGKKSSAVNAVHYNNRGLAYFHTSSDDWAKRNALDDFNSALEINPRDPNILYNKGNVHLSMNEFDQARHEFE